MSVRTLETSSIGARVAPQGRINTYTPTPWVRNPNWIPIPAFAPGENAVYLLVAVKDGLANAFAMQITALTSGALTYTVDWGDGSAIDTQTTPGVLDHTYNYANPALNNSIPEYKQALIKVAITSNPNNLDWKFAWTIPPNYSVNGYIIDVLDEAFGGDRFGDATNHLSTTSAVVCPNLERITIASCRSTGLYAPGQTSIFTFQNLKNLQRVEFGSGVKVNHTPSLFSECNKLTEIIGLTVSNSTAISFAQHQFGAMFNGCRSLTSVEINGLDTIPSNTNVTTTSMFNNCSNLISVADFPKTLEVTGVANMFSNCSNLIRAPYINTVDLTDASLMFLNCYNLTTVPKYNTANVTGMFGMFQSCSSLTTVPLFDTVKVSNFENMFQSCNSLTTVPLFNTGAATNMRNMFNGCSSLQSVPLFNTASAQFMTNMFGSCSSLQSVPLFNTSNATSMNTMFRNCSSLTTVPLFDTSKVTNMSNMFNGCTNLQSVPNFNTPLLANTSTFYLFANCNNLKVAPLIDLNGSTGLGNMFQSCRSLTTLPLYDMSTVTNVGNMLNGCDSLMEIPAWVMNPNCTYINFLANSNSIRHLQRVRMIGIGQTINFSFHSLNAAALDEIYTNLATVTGSKTITVTGNPGVTGDNPAIATAKGWTVVG